MTLLRISPPERCRWAGKDRGGTTEYGYWRATAWADGIPFGISRRTLSDLKARIAELRWRARTGKRIFGGGR
jgi:hypothetical protein